MISCTKTVSEPWTTRGRPITSNVAGPTKGGVAQICTLPERTYEAAASRPIARSSRAAVSLGPS